MATRETELPGVGTKHSIELGESEELVVVDHRVGHWELAHVDGDGKTTPLLRLEPKQAAELGRILSQGEVPQEDPRKQMLFEQFCLEWVKLEANSPLVGQSLEESGIRAQTGSSVIAVLRGEQGIASPPPDTRFEAEDTIVLIGHADQIDQFLQTYTDLATS